MAKKYQVTLLFIDEKENHKKALPQIGIEQYQGIECFETYQEFENFMEHPENKNLSILLFIHVFRLDDLKGYESANKNMIERAYPNLRIHWVTSNQPGATGDKINQQHNTFKYDTIPDFIDSGDLLSIPISEAKIKNSTALKIDEEYIFISHSSEDVELVTSFFENLIRLGLDVPRKNVFYSSHSSTGIPTGEDIPDKLKEAFQKMTMFIQYVTEDYKKSEVCLNEMGAAWLKLEKNRIITLKAPDIKFTQIGFLNIQRIGLSIDKKDDLLKIAEDYKDLFDFNSVNFNNKVDKFLEENKL